ncbi:MAG TPA: valine--tRNA ligase [Candidatus Woesebacteria bacterium]|nr:valine--tRNA ligase [Candidatus Woesebacteria bacterium]
MDTQYKHAQHEAKIYQVWEKSDIFTAKKSDLGKQPAFTIIMPPPNANDPLHLGHAMFITIEDILIRYHRMLGETTLWLPGTDHAGIETQYVFEKKLAKENKSRFQFSRDQLYQDIWQYVQTNVGVAIDQMKKLGASADWSRYKFTLDKDIVEFVTNTFGQMHQQGLIYRDLKLVNYCVKCGTSYSDLEVKHLTQTSPLYYIKYGPLEVATVRPETKFGDVALAVNPKDKRYQKYIGQKVKITCVAGVSELPVIGDDRVDQNFGTGVLKITPAHDHTDFEIAQTHSLPLKQVIDFRGKLINCPESYSNLNVNQARAQLVTELEKLDLITKVDQQYSNSVGVCYRCGKVLEPLPLPQFFVAVNKPDNNLSRKALEFLTTKQIKIHGAGKDKILRHWLKNLRDWNISRQIVWGIRIPVWYPTAGRENQIQVKFIDSNHQLQQTTLVEALSDHSLEVIESGLQTINVPLGTPYVVAQHKPKDGQSYLPETDTLDTWFSSAQWPVATLKTNHPGDFDHFYPTSIMETAYDILPFWVMRMMLMGGYLTNKPPFKQVYFHGLIRDSKGQKMSKSKGNVLNPIEVAEKYSTDALRLALVIRSTPGQDKSVGEPDFQAARNFTNKIWNASRYVLMQFDSDETSSTTPYPTKISSNYQKKLSELTLSVGKKLDSLKIGQASDQLYSQFWHWFCDEMIELHKQGKLDKHTLLQTLTVFLQLLHPFVPFITERVWQELYAKKLVEAEVLAAYHWPKS